MKLLGMLIFLVPLLSWGKPKYLKPNSEDSRLRYLASAELWQPTDLENLDILGGPDSKIKQPHNQLLTCDFEAAGKIAYRGNSLKFKCKFGDNSLKVKYLRDRKENREVFSEVAATRLFWALGFFADRVFPIQTSCNNCPENPFEGKGEAATRFYPYSIIEEKHEGLEIKGSESEGWTFEELETTAGIVDQKLPKILNPRQIQVEALKLLAVFVQHADRKPEQQRLSCPSDQIENSDLTLEKDGNDEFIVEPSGQQLCRKPQMLIQDLGASFGGFTGISLTVDAKMNLEKWSDVTIFNEKFYKKSFDKNLGSGICEGNMRISFKAGGDHGRPDPIIHEQGRAFLADLLVRFRNSGKVRPLFEAANVDALKGEIGGVDAWEKVFNRKVDEIDKHRCCVPDEKRKTCLK